MRLKTTFVLNSFIKQLKLGGFYIYATNNTRDFSMTSTQQRALCAIEILLFWESQINRKRLAILLGLSESRASQFIKRYEENFPGFICYDEKKKCHYPTEHFQPQLTTGTTDEYLQLILRQKQHTATTEVISAPQRYVIPDVLKTICNAIQKSPQQLNVIYQSLQNPDDSQQRIITPHTLVFSGLRWHVRAFCEKSKTFKDFVLSRFAQTEKAEFGQVTVEQDTHWQTFEELVIMADPRLTESQRKLIEREHGMNESRLVIETRGALIRYQMELLNIDTGNPNPESQQIIVESACWKRIQPYLNEACGL